MLLQTFRTPNAYFHPKTHKDDFLTNFKFCPIISSFDLFSSRLSKYSYLADLLKTQMCIYSEREEGREQTQ